MKAGETMAAAQPSPPLRGRVMEAAIDHEALVATWRAGHAQLDPARAPAPGIINVEPGPVGRAGVWGFVTR